MFRVLCNLHMTGFYKRTQLHLLRERVCPCVSGSGCRMRIVSSLCCSRRHLHCYKRRHLYRQIAFLPSAQISNTATSFTYQSCILYKFCEICSCCLPFSHITKLWAPNCPLRWPLLSCIATYPIKIKYYTWLYEQSSFEL